jgi:hydroxymethylbilane synthase
MPADELAQYLVPRKAVLKLSASVTSLDGQTHVVYDAPEQVVSSWQSAQAWGEECARKLRSMGASEVLDVINEQRRAREAEDIERAKQVKQASEAQYKAQAAAQGAEKIEGYTEGMVPAQ